MTNKFFRYLLCAAAIIFSASFAAACKPPQPDPPVPPEKEVLFGFAEPMTNSQVKEFNQQKTANLAKAMNAKSFRSFIDIDVIENVSVSNASVSTLTLSASKKKLYDNTHTMLRGAGIEQIVGAVGFYPRVPSTHSAADINTVPNPFKATPDSDYTLFLEKVEQCWYEMAKGFPDITLWEVGNEPNMNGFLHPVTYVANAGQDLAADMSSNPTCFNMEQKAAVLTDIMFYANRGMKRGNPDTTLIVPGLAPVGFLDKHAMRIFLEQIYENINSGNFPSSLQTKSTKSADYFQGLAWHPYYHMDKAPDAAWTTLNDAIFNVAVQNGDGHLRVWFTEFGMSDISTTDEGSTDENQALWYAEYFRQMKEMEYLEACHIFRMYECSVATGWGGIVEWKYGIFKEPEGAAGFVPKKKALALYELMGGKGDINMYA